LRAIRQPGQRHLADRIRRAVLVTDSGVEILTTHDQRLP